MHALILLPLLLACSPTKVGGTDPTDGGGTDGGGSDGGGADGGGTDGGGDGGAELAWGDLLIVDVLPATLPEASGGDFTLLTRARVDLSPGTSSLQTSSFGELPLSLSSHEGDLLRFDGKLPADSGVVGLEVGTLVVDGVEIASVPLRLYRDAEEYVDELDPVHSSPRFAGLDFDPRSVALIPSETAATGFDLSALSWSSEGGELQLDRVSDRDGLVSSLVLSSEVLADDARAAGRGHVTVLKARGEDGELVVLTGENAVEAFFIAQRDSGPVSTALDHDLSGDRLPQIVLDIAPVELGDEALPGLAILGLDQDSRGTWYGLSWDGQEASTWDAETMGVSPQDVAEGEAWAGIVHEGRVRTATEAGDFWTWTFDPSGEPGSCLGTLTVRQHGSGLATGRRQVQDNPDATAERGRCATFDDARAAAVRAVDLGGDGFTDLVLRVWGADLSGEATEVAWWIPDITNPRSRATAVKLVGAVSAPGYRPAPLGDWPAEADEPVDSSFAEPGVHLHGGAGDEHLSLDGLQILSTDLDGAPATVAHVLNSWNVRELVAAGESSVSGETELGATGGGVHGQSKAATHRGHVTVLKASDSGGHGVCHMGRCFCDPGWAGTTMELGSGAGTDAADAADLAQGDLIWFGSSVPGGAPVASRPWWQSITSSAPAVESRTGSGDGAFTAARLGDGSSVIISGGNLDIRDASYCSFTDSTIDIQLFEQGPGWVMATMSDAVMAREGDSGFAILLGSMDDDPCRSGDLYFRPPADTVVGGSSAPVALGEPGEDGGLLLFWRDGMGQAWLGRVDLLTASTQDGGELPFLVPPVAIGDADPTVFAELGLSAERPLAVGSRRLPLGESYLSQEDAALRFADWESPMEVPFAGYERAAGTDAWMTVPWASSACGFATVVLPDDLLGEGWEAAALVLEPAERDCSDLAVPLSAGDMLPDSSQAMVMGHGSGSIRIDILPDGRVYYRSDIVSNPISTTSAAEHNPLWGLRLSSGDSDGDGLDDVLVAAWDRGGALLMGSDGNGGLHLLVEEHILDGIVGFASPGPGRPAAVDEDLRVPLRGIEKQDLRRGMY